MSDSSDLPATFDGLRAALSDMARERAEEARRREVPRRLGQLSDVDLVHLAAADPSKARSYWRSLARSTWADVALTEKQRKGIAREREALAREAGSREAAAVRSRILSPPTTVARCRPGELYALGLDGAPAHQELAESQRAAIANHWRAHVGLPAVEPVEPVERVERVELAETSPASPAPENNMKLRGRLLTLDMGEPEDIRALPFNPEDEDDPDHPTHWQLVQDGLPEGETSSDTVRRRARMDRREAAREAWESYTAAVSEAERHGGDPRRAGDDSPDDPFVRCTASRFGVTPEDVSRIARMTADSPELRAVLESRGIDPDADDVDDRDLEDSRAALLGRLTTQRAAERQEREYVATEARAEFDRLTAEAQRLDAAPVLSGADRGRLTYIKRRVKTLATELNRTDAAPPDEDVRSSKAAAPT